ncbi:hypothetical protein B0T09DRAFT_323410 [Sordaria sp. MPI-SDFR-AT-0083]|nr:hypothetical protein B0T09DRAFT_323410 [Sordaria sp. MPI-SDFR-AT-0083]
MAILTCLPGLEVTIEVDGQRAQEYDADPNEVESRAEEIDFHSIQQQTHHNHLRRRRRRFRFGAASAPAPAPAPYVLKYIEAKPGKPFGFIFDMRNCPNLEDVFSSIRAGTEGPSIYYSCVLDGFSTGKKHVYSGTRDTRYSCTTGSDAAGWKKNKFRFRSLDVLEGSDGTQSQSQSQASKAKEYGTLLVKLYLVGKRGRLVPHPGRAGPTLIDSVCEKDLKGKALDSKVRFDSEPIARPGPGRKRKFVDHRGRPFAVFEFRYRTMEGLYQEAVISRRAVPTLVLKIEKFEDEQEVVDVDVEEKVKQRLITIKQEPEEDSMRQPKGIKREAPMPMD